MSTASDAHDVANVVALNIANTANNARDVVNAMGALFVNTANDANFVSVAAALRIASTCGLPANANYAHSVIYVVP